MKLVPPRALAVALVLVLAPLAMTASARADFGLSAVDPVPSVPSRGGSVPGGDPFAAAAHPDMAINLTFADRGDPGADSVEGLEIDLAPGIVAYVNHVPACDTWDASTQAATACPDSVVGEAVTNVTALVTLPGLPYPIGTRLPLRLLGTIYRVPSPDPSRYPTAFGIDIEPPIAGLTRRVKLVSPISVNPHTLGLTASLSGLPDEASGLPLHIDAITQVLYGYTPTGRAFFTSPTSCGPAPIRVTATSHAGATSSNAGSYTPTDCGGVPFDISFATSADPATADSTSTISFNVQPGAGTAERVSAHVRTTTVVAAPGILLNPALAARLDACTDAGFAQADTSVAASCPASSEVGTINFRSPILGDFPGTVYFGTQTPSERLRLFLDVPLFGAHIKVSASVNPDYDTGQVTTVFSQLPQIAFTDFRLTFRGGSQSALVTPTTCGPTVSTAIAGPWSGGPQAEASGAFETTGCERRFTPSMATAVAPSQAGAETAFTLSFTRPDRTVPVGRVAFDLPPGLIGSLALPGLTKCQLAAAAMNACPGSSRIGGVASVVGSGGEPPTLPGSIYLTEPKQAGDPAGLSVSVPARLGPVDAGVVTVGQRLVLGNDGGLDVISDPIPALQLGIPLAIRRLTVTIDRQGFMRNPTACGELPASGAFSALDGGPGATASSSITVSGCERLAFAPKITGEVSGKRAAKVQAHPALTTTITQRAGEAAMKRAVVTTPRSLSTNLDTVNSACPPETLAADASRCDPAAHVGSAKAVSPLVSEPLSGPVYLERQPGLPRLVVRLRGEVSLDLLGTIRIGRGGVIVTTFGSIPDLALSRFELRFRGGRDGVLTTVGDLCARGERLTAAFTSHSGRSADRRPRLSVEGCPPRTRARMRFRHGRGLLGVRTTTPRDAPLRWMRVRVPRALRLGGARVVAKAGGKRLGRKATRVHGRAVTVRLPRRGRRNVLVRVRGVRAGSRRVARRLAQRRGTPRLTSRTIQRAGQRDRARVVIRLR